MPAHQEALERPIDCPLGTGLKGVVSFRCRLTDEVTGDRVGSWMPRKILAADFLYVSYCYAMTVHRTQGQTCDYAYCMPGDLLKVSGLMGDSLSSVATTRARKQLAITL